MPGVPRPEDRWLLADWPMDAICDLAGQAQAVEPEMLRRLSVGAGTDTDVEQLLAAFDSYPPLLRVFAAKLVRSPYVARHNLGASLLRLAAGR